MSILLGTSIRDGGVMSNINEWDEDPFKNREDEEGCDTCKWDNICNVGCESGIPTKYKYERKEEVV